MIYAGLIPCHEHRVRGFSPKILTKGQLRYATPTAGLLFKGRYMTSSQPSESGTAADEVHHQVPGMSLSVHHLSNSQAKADAERAKSFVRDK